jgi:hypothetical protein
MANASPVRAAGGCARKAAMHGARPCCAATLNNHSGGENFVLKNYMSIVFFAYFSHVGVTTPLGMMGVGRDSRRVGNLKWE